VLSLVGQGQVARREEISPCPAIETSEVDHTCLQMSLPAVDSPVSLCHTDSPHATGPRTPRPLLWALASLLAGCSPPEQVEVGTADDDGTAGVATTGSSSDAGDADSTTPGTTAADTTAPETTASSGEDTGPVDPSVAEGSSGTDDTGTTGDETAADGCWDQSGFYDAYDDGLELDPFVCPSLPVPCDTVVLHFFGPSDCEAGTYTFTVDTIAALDEAEAAARCVLESMRDGEAAVHEIELHSGYETIEGRYLVLGAGVVTEISWITDLSGPLDQRLLAPRDREWFDACLAAPDIHGLVPCLWPASVPGLQISGATPCGDGPFGPVDLDACIGEDPTCP